MKLDNDERSKIEREIWSHLKYMDNKDLVILYNKLNWLKSEKLKEPKPLTY